MFSLFAEFVPLYLSTWWNYHWPTLIYVVPWGVN